VTLAVDGSGIGTPGRAQATRKQVLEMARDVVSDDGTWIVIREWGGSLARWRASGKAQDAGCELMEVEP
jgi:hypothetical protein